MRVSTPTISWHNRERVSSLDFQPAPFPGPTPGAQTGSTRLATAGDDKHVIIWEIVVDDEGKVEPRCLCDISRHHQNSVNTVRWSPNGRLLASGDTDSAVFLWHYNKDAEAAAPDIFAEDGDPSENVENWTLHKILRGHLQDVVGLCWSPDSAFLASCSTDSTAVIFDVKKATKVKIISDHKGWVNGVAWDPQNKFLATIASDRCLRVYSTKGYKAVSKTYKCGLPSTSQGESAEEERTTRLFHDDTFMSFYRRMDFSPDGELLAIPSGVLDFEGASKVSHCTHIFSRSNFSKPVLSLPSREFSICVRFSPVKYELRPTPRSLESSTEAVEVWERYDTLFCLPYRLVYAIATQNAILFYDTQQAEPFAKVSRIHYIGLNDLAWSSDGLSLVVASTDGFCSVVNFKASDLGNVYKQECVNEQKVDVEQDDTDLKLVPGKPQESCAVPEVKENQNKPSDKKRVQLITLTK